MLKKYGKRFLAFALVLSFVISMSSTFFTEAASKKVTVYVISKVTTQAENNINIHTLKYNKHGQLKSISIKPNNKGVKSFVQKYTYKDKRLKSINFAGTFINAVDNKLSTDKQDFAFTYKKGVISKVIETEVFDGGNKTTETTTFKKGNPTKKVSKNGSDKTTEVYKYDSKNRIKECIFTDCYGKSKSVSTYSYTYNKKDQITCELIDNKDNKNGYKNVFSYNSKGNIKLIKHYTEQPDGKLKLSYTCDVINEYDKQGHLTKAAEKTIMGNPTNKVTITYKKISIPKEYLEAVEKQQNDILIEADINPSAYHVEYYIHRYL